MSAAAPRSAAPIRTRRTRSIAVGLALALSALAPVVRAADDPPPTFQVIPDTLRADTLGIWRASLMVENHGEWGLYPDSLSLDWKSLDDEPSAAPRQGTTPLSALVRAMEPASARAATGLEWSAPADFERGTLTFHFHLHDAKKRPFSLHATVPVVGNDLYDRHPRVALEAGGQKVEVVDVPAPPQSGPVPGVLYVPPAGVSARMALRWAQQVSARGHAVSIVSLPGTGGSSGTSDRAGPASVAAVEAALAHLGRIPGVDGKRLAVWGLADGATTALLAAARHPELAGVVAQNAEYDPWRAYRELPATERGAFVRAVGSDSASWRARSAGAAATRITSPVLVIHSAGMPAWSVASAEAFTLARAARNLPSESRIEGATTAAAPGQRQGAQRLAIDFLTRRLRNP